ncbi:MAG: hypothetical protein D6784_18080, partial [Chloroflexi bacterium]
MNWETILQNIHTQDALLLWWAKAGTWGGWEVLWWVGAVVAAIGLIAAFFLKNQPLSLETLIRSPVRFSWLLSVLSLLVWRFVLNYASTPSNILNLLHPGAKEIWQLSPSEITLLLETLRSLALLNVLLACTGLGWILVWGLPKLNPGKSSTTSVPEEGEEQDTASESLSETAPTTTPATTGFQLKFVSANKPAIAGLQYEGENKTAGDRLEIRGEHLYISTKEKREYITATRNLPPDTNEAEWVPLRYNPDDHTLTGPLSTSAPEWEGEPCFGPDSAGETEQKSVKSNDSFWINKILHFKYLGPLST